MTGDGRACYGESLFMVWEGEGRREGESLFMVWEGEGGREGGRVCTHPSVNNH